MRKPQENPAKSGPDVENVALRSHAPKSGATNERVPFRLIICEHCAHNFCWINPRPPTYCPECGQNIFAHIRENTLVNEPAWLRIVYGSGGPVVEGGH